MVGAIHSEYSLSEQKLGYWCSESNISALLSCCFGLSVPVCLWETGSDLKFININWHHWSYENVKQEQYLLPEYE